MQVWEIFDKFNFDTSNLDAVAFENDYGQQRIFVGTGMPDEDVLDYLKGGDYKEMGLLDELNPGYEMEELGSKKVFSYEIILGDCDKWKGHIIMKINLGPQKLK